MIFVGDALFPGGNDYPAKEAGVLSIQVRDPNESKRVIETIIACLGGGPKELPQSKQRPGLMLHNLAEEPAIILWNASAEILFDSVPNQRAGERRAIERWENEGGEIPVNAATVRS